MRMRKAEAIFRSCWKICIEKAKREIEDYKRRHRK